MTIIGLIAALVTLAGIVLKVFWGGWAEKRASRKEKELRRRKYAQAREKYERALADDDLDAINSWWAELDRLRE